MQADVDARARGPDPDQAVVDRDPHLGPPSRRHSAAEQSRKGDDEPFDTGTFSFRARVRGVELEAMNVVRVDEQGQIVECKVFARPLPALATLFSALPPRVATRRRGRPIGALVALVARPRAFVLRAADRVAPTLV